MSETHSFDKDGKWLLCRCSVTAHAFNERCPQLQTTLQSFVSPDPRPAILTEDDGPQTPYRPKSLLPDVNPPLPTTAWRCGCSVMAHSSREVSECRYRQAFYLTEAAYNQTRQQLDGKAAVLYCQGETDSTQSRPTKRIAELEMQNRILQQQLDVAKAECARLTALLPVEKKVDPWANALRWSV